MPRTDVGDSNLATITDSGIALACVSLGRRSKRRLSVASPHKTCVTRGKRMVGLVEFGKVGAVVKSKNFSTAVLVKKH